MKSQTLDPNPLEILSHCKQKSGVLNRLILLFCCLLFGATASVQAQIHLYADSVSGANGSQVIVPIRANDFTNLIGAQGTVEWETSVVTYDAVLQFGLPSMTVANFGVSQTAAGKLTLSWDDPTLAGVNLADSSVLFAIRFNVVGSPGSQTPIRFVNAPTSVEFIDINFTTPPFTTDSGKVEVPLGANCVVQDLAAGTQSACVPATNLYTQEVVVTYANAPATGNLEVNGQSFTIGTSPQTVVLTGLVSDGSPVNVTAQFSSDSTCSRTETALFSAPASCTRLTMFADSVQGAQGGQVIVPVRVNSFEDVIGAQASITWNTSIVTYDTVFQFGLPGMNPSNFGVTQTASGVLTFSWDDPTLAGINLTDSTTIFALRFDVVGPLGSQTPVSFASTPTLIEFTDDAFSTIPFDTVGGEVEIPIGANCFVNDLQAGSQGACNPVTNFYTQDVIVTYSNAPATGTLTVNGQSFAIGTSPQTVTLTNLISNGQPVDVAASFSADTTCNRTETALYTAPANCASTDLTIIADSLQGAQGGQVTVPVRVRFFQDIIGAQGTVQWDPAVASYNSVTAFGLPAMSVANFGLGQTASGRLTFSWDDPTLVGVNLADSTVIFSVVFDVVGGPGSNTPVSFVNSPTLMEFTDNTFNTVPFDTISGEIDVPLGVNCVFQDISAGTQSACDSLTNTYTQEVVVTYTNAPATGSLEVNGQSFAIGTSPQTVLLAGLASDGSPVDVTARFSADTSCSDTETALFTAPASCNKLTMFADSLQGTQGSQVVVPVRVNSFADVIGAQASVNWNTSIVTFDTVFQFGLPGMNPSNFGVTQTASGALTFSWDDPTLQGVGLPDSTVIFALRFDVVGPLGSQTPISFVNSPTLIEFTDNAFNTIPFVTVGGEVEIPIGANCFVNDLQVGSQGACDPANNLYTQDVIVTYSNAPATGSLLVNGQTFAIGTSPQTVTLTNLISNGQPVDVTASFSADTTCNRMEAALFTAAASCITTDLTIIADSLQGMQGGQVTVPVRVRFFQDIIGAQGTVEWDPSVASYNSVISFGLPAMSIANFGLGQTAGGRLTFSWDDPTLVGVNLADSTVIFSIVFDVVGGPGSNTPVRFVNSPTLMEFTDNTFNTVQFDTVSGEIDVPLGVSCVIQDLSAGIQSACDSLTNSYSQDVVVTYQNAPATGSIEVSGQTFAIGTSPQTVTLLGLPSDGQPVDLTARFTADTACTYSETGVFNAATSCGVLVVFADSLQGTNGSQVIVPVRTKLFSDLIGAQGTIEWDPTVVTYNSVQQFGLPFLSAANFGISQVGSGKLTFSWDDPTLAGVTVADSAVLFAIQFTVVGGPGSVSEVALVNTPTLLEFTDNGFSSVPFTSINGQVEVPITGCAVVDLQAGTQTACNPVDNRYTQELVVVHANAPATGNLIVNGQSFPIAPSPQTVVLTNLVADGAAVNATAFFSDDSTCSRVETNLFTAPANCGTLTLYADSVQGAFGSQVIVPVRANNFADLIGGQGTIRWNTSVATYDAVLQFGLPNLGVANFGIAQVASGRLTFSWDDPTLAGVSVPDSTVLFAIRFNVVGGQGSVTPVALASTPTSIEFTDDSFATVAFDTIPGEIEVPFTSGCIVNSVVAGSQTPCNPSTNTYSQEITVSYSSQPAAGFLDVNGQLFGITSSPQTITLNGLIANGNLVDVRARFTADTACFRLENGLFQAPFSCISSDLTLIGDSVEGATGQQVVLPIRVRNFNDLIGSQGTVTWDTSVATFSTVLNFGLPAMGISNFGLTQTAGGSLTFSWDDPTLGGVSLADSAVIFAIRFTCVGALGTQTPVQFVNTPTLLEFTDNTFNTVPYDTIPGEVSIPLASIVTGTLANTFFCVGDTVQIPFTAGGLYGTGNVFSAQISNASGSFASPIIIGTLAGTSSGTIQAVIPALPGGTAYRIRVVSDNPVIVGTDNGLDLTVSNIQVNATASICDGDSIFLGGSFQTAAGSFVDTLVSGNGCDSVVTTSLTVLPNSAFVQNVEICFGDSVFAGGSFQTTSGTYVDTLVAANGCDSVLTTMLNVLIGIQTNLTAEICDGDSIFLAGAFQTTAGSYVDSLIASAGCDSLVITALTVLPNADSTVNVSICDGDSLFAGGAFQTVSGSYMDTLVAANGCDSVVTTVLNVLPNSATALNESICAGDSFFVGGSFQTVAGTYTDTLLAANGCDSVVTTVLTVLPTFASSDSVSICDGDSIFVGGTFQSMAGIYLDTLTAGNGCDSIVTTTLNILPTFAVNDVAAICAGDSILLGGAFQTTAGSYIDTLITVDGCDSIVTTALTVVPSIQTNLTADICDGDSIFLAGAFQTTAGSYSDSLIASGGCDSIVTTVLTVLPNADSTVNVSICDGDSLFAGGAFQTVSGSYMDTLVAANGCDSVLTTALTVLPNSATALNESICAGDSFFVGGSFQTVAGTYTDTLLAGNGCDSVVTTELTVLPTFASSDSVSICDGDSLFVGGAFQSTAGSYLDTLTAGNGCDSVVTTVLNILPTFNVNDVAAICAGDSILLGGAFQTTAGSYIDTLVTVDGCDSVVTTALTVVASIQTNLTADICDGDSIFLGGAFQSTAGSYVDSLTASGGCDSIVTTVLTVLPNADSTVNVSICDGDSLFAGGAFQTVSGSYMDTLVAANGCDSVLTTALTVLPNSATALNESICAGDSFFVGGSFQTVAGTYTDTLLAGNGCDSVVTTVLTVLPTFASSDSVSICDGDSLFVGGAFQSTAGSYLDTLMAGNGCDSVVTTVLNILPTFNVNDVAAICAGDSILLGGAFQTTAGSYIDTLITVDGCDSVVTTALTVVASIQTNLTADICDGDSIFLGGAFQSTAGSYVDSLTASGGCDSIVTTVLTVLPNADSTVNVSICDGDSLFAGGAFQTVSGSYMDTLVAANGCDSVLTTALTVLPNSATALNESICAGDSFFVGGSFQTVAGTYTDTLLAGNGCDSVVTTVLTVLPTFASSDSVSICDGDSLFVGGAFQSTAGSYLDTLTAGNGCDSVVTTVLNILPTFNVNDVAAICAGDSILLGGAFQTTAGSYIDTLITVDGCDSVVTTALTVVASIQTNLTADICDGDSIFLGGAFQNTAGSYVDSLTASGGCDSIVTTVLTVLPNADSTVNVSICDGDSLFAGGAFQTVSGSYMDTLVAANGCDSVLTTALTVLPNSATALNESICAGDSFFVGGAFQTVAGTYTDTLLAGNGCDSVVTTVLTVLPTFASTANVSICDGDSLFVGGAFQSTAGSYLDTLTAGNGCDSVVTTVLNILPTFNVNDVAAICAGDSILLGGAFQTTAGSYIDTLVTVDGCDSVVTTALTVVASIQTNLTADICDGDSIFLGGAFQNTAGSYVDSLTASGGCDSIVTTVLTVLPNADSTVNVSICDGDSLFAGGAFQTVSGSYMDTLVAANGCDSVLTTALTVLPNSATALNESICAGDSFFVGGAFQTVAGTYTDTLLAGNGCDSVVTTVLTVLPTFASTANVSICDGDSLFVGGAFQSTAGSYLDTLTAGNGCDSVVTTVLSILPTFAVNDMAAICAGDSIFLGGAFQTTAGSYIDTLLSVGGCDSVVTTALSILPVANGNDSLTICGGDSVFLGGAFQTLAGNYVDTLIAANGCDSILTTMLTVLPNSSSTVSESICDGDSLFVGGSFQTTAGSYLDTLVAANGCDSIVTTVLTVLPNAASSLNLSICDGDSVFAGGGFQTTSGVYTDTLVAANGCDSVVTTQLLVLPTYNQTVNIDLCDGDSVFVGGAFQTLAGTYVDSLSTGAGCDSIVNSVVSIVPTYIEVDSLTICSGDSVFLGGAWQFTSGIYNDSLLSVAGCDSVVSTDLTVLAIPQTLQFAQICTGDSIFLGGAWQSSPGIYRDTLTATTGCDSVVRTTLSLLGLPNAPLISPAGPLDLCVGDSLTLVSSSAVGNTWQPNGETSNSIVVTQPGSYTVTLTDSNGCTSLPSVPVVVNSDSLVVGGFSFLANQLTVDFTDQSSQSPFAWTWDFGDGNNSMLQNPQHTFALPGTYTVCLTVENTCGLDTFCQIVMVSCPAPVVAFAFSGNVTQMDFSDQTSGGATTWAWDFGDGNSSAQQNPSHTYASPGIYTVCLTASSDCGSDSLCQQVDVLVGVNDASIPADWRVYPNPGNGQFFLEGDLQRARVQRIQVVDVLGQVVWERANGWIDGVPMLIDLTQLSNAPYILRIETAKGSYFHRLVKGM